VVLEGRRLVEDALLAGAPIIGVVAADDADALNSLVNLAVDRGIQVERVSAKELADLADTEHPSGIIAVADWEPVEIRALAAPASAATFLVLDAIQDPGNVGTMLRTALALGAAGVIALDGTADVRSAKVLRAAMGAHFRLPVAEGSLEDAVAFFTRHHVAALLSDAGADEPPGRRIGERVALVVGNEGQGVRAEWTAHAARRVGIPMAKGAESLNAAVACGIMLYELTRGA
jgi:TrmH family RNA methyltransferase